MQARLIEVIHMGVYSSSPPPRNPKGFRAGYTTGSNAAAAAKAATLALFTRRWSEDVMITLPIGETAVMRPIQRWLFGDGAFCCVMKDAGDDPDVTHGALICASVRRMKTPGMKIDGGRGVGRVTLPGLGLDIGEAAINPVPRRQICDNVLDAIGEAQIEVENCLETFGLEVVISVPQGERLAAKTLNPKLGIVGGVSILGTTGKVFPYSTAAWRASVIQVVEMAAYNNVEKVALATGGRSERFAQRLFPELPRAAFVEMGIFTGDALRTCVAHGVHSVALVGMIGKLIKTAQGHMTTHVAGNQVDFTFLAHVCRQTGAPEGLTKAVAAANTARHFLELCKQWKFLAPVRRIAELARDSCLHYIAEQRGAMKVEVVLVDFDGNALHHAFPSDSFATAIRPPNSGHARGQRADAERSPLVQRLAAAPLSAYENDSDGRAVEE